MKSFTIGRTFLCFWWDLGSFTYINISKTTESWTTGAPTLASRKPSQAWTSIVSGSVRLCHLSLRPLLLLLLLPLLLFKNHKVGHYNIVTIYDVLNHRGLHTARHFKSIYNVMTQTAQVSPSVSCGQHRAQSCATCPQVTAPLSSIPKFSRAE